MLPLLRQASCSCGLNPGARQSGGQPGPNHQDAHGQVRDMLVEAAWAASPARRARCVSSTRASNGTERTPGGRRPGRDPVILPRDAGAHARSDRGPCPQPSPRVA
ncbi:transposase [Streptomyces chartreusis]|uniref:transposase n=1 Tax=Streptomyces chartreusis TaxID=1969 RepID=UPI00399B5AB9